MTSTLEREVAAEHAVFAAALDELLELAEDCTVAAPEALLRRIDAALDFFHGELLPHAAAEEAVLYPAVAELLGAPQATDTMRRDHTEIRRLVRELQRHAEEVGSPVLPLARHELVRVLHALHDVVSLHLAKEDELYLPLLAHHLDEERTTALLHSLRGATESDAADGLAADGG